MAERDRQKENRKTRWVTIRIYRTPDFDKRNRNKKSRGRSSGLLITEYLASVFFANERLPPYSKLTDTAIAKALLREFPESSKVRSLISGNVTINMYRNKYNRGILTGKIPDQFSHRWSHEGKILDGSLGRELTPEQIAALPKSNIPAKELDKLGNIHLDISKIMVPKHTDRIRPEWRKREIEKYHATKPRTHEFSLEGNKQDESQIERIEGQGIDEQADDGRA